MSATPDPYAEHWTALAEACERMSGNVSDQTAREVCNAIDRLTEALTGEVQPVAAPQGAGMGPICAALVYALRQIEELGGQWNNGIWAANIARTAIAKAESAALAAAPAAPASVPPGWQIERRTSSDGARFISIYAPQSTSPGVRTSDSVYEHGNRDLYELLGRLADELSQQRGTKP